MTNWEVSQWSPGDMAPLSIAVTVKWCMAGKEKAGSCSARCSFLINMPANNSRERLPAQLLPLACSKGTQISRARGISTGRTDGGFGEEGKLGLVRPRRSFWLTRCSAIGPGVVSSVQAQLLIPGIIGCVRSSCWEWLQCQGLPGETQPAITCLSNLTLMHFDLGVRQTQYYFKGHWAKIPTTYADWPQALLLYWYHGALRWIYSLTQFVQGKSDFK